MYIQPTIGNICIEFAKVTRDQDLGIFGFKVYLIVFGNIDGYLSFQFGLGTNIFPIGIKDSSIAILATAPCKSAAIDGIGTTTHGSGFDFNRTGRRTQTDIEFFKPFLVSNFCALALIINGGHNFHFGLFPGFDFNGAVIVFNINVLRF